MKNLSKKNLEKIVSRMGQHRIMVLGDVMLDRYIWGNVSRVSPEAPVPIVQADKTDERLGGAANVALNLKELGDFPILIGISGEDSESFILKTKLRENGILVDGLIADKNRPTTTKTRIVAHNQHVVRIDHEKTEEASPAVTEKILNKIQANLNRIRAIIISDYGKGVITKTLLEELISLAKQKGLFIAVDPKDTHFFNYKRVSIITPNHHEASFVGGRRITNRTVLKEVGRKLLYDLRAEALLITRGEDGMTLFQLDKEPYEIPTVARQVYDVTGAGDTVISSLVSAVCAGADLKESAWIANHAAGYVIREIGTAQISRPELLQEIRNNSKF